VDEENVRAYLELINNKLETIELIVFGSKPLHLPGILERIENAERRARRAIWILALCTSIIWLLTVLTMVGYIVTVGRSV
jgi:hypothetical protein